MTEHSCAICHHRIDGPDLIELSDYRLVCGDCAEAEHLARRDTTHTEEGETL